jgi:hypothetical protein
MEKIEIRILRFIKDLCDTIFEYWFVIFGFLWMFNGITVIFPDKEEPKVQQTQQTQQVQQETKKEDGPKPSF